MAQSTPEENEVLEVEAATGKTAKNEMSTDAKVDTTVIMLLTQCDGKIALRPDPGSTYGSGMVAKLPSKKFQDISEVKEMLKCTVTIFTANDPNNAKFILNQKMVSKSFRFGSTEFFVFYVKTQRKIQNDAISYFNAGILTHKRPGEKVIIDNNHWEVPPAVVKAIDLFKEEF